MAKKKSGESPAETEAMALLEEALALLLPEDNARMAMRQMKSRLGSLERMMQAPEGELAAIPGMDRNSARYLRLTLELARAYMKNAAEYAQDVLDFDCFVELLRPEFLERNAESVAVLLLDSGGRQLYMGSIFEGGVGEVTVNFRRLVGLCANCNASGLVLAHNHPTGSVYPSMEDIMVTGQVMLALIGIGVGLTDHIIFAGRDEFSFARSGLLKAMSELTLKECREQMEKTQKIAVGFLKERN